MGVISISEESTDTDGCNAVVRFDNGPKYPVAVSDPFSEAEEKLLEWYFEEHLIFPFTRQVAARTAADSIKSYGEAMFKQVFSGEVGFRYKELVQALISI